MAAGSWGTISALYKLPFELPVVGTVIKSEVTTDEILALIIMGKAPGEVTERELASLHQ